MHWRGGVEPDVSVPAPPGLDEASDMAIPMTRGPPTYVDPEMGYSDDDDDFDHVTAVS